jgi:LAO/AO transport system kinase
MFKNLLQLIQTGNPKALARCISLVENEVAGHIDFLKSLPNSATPIIGITGAPGAGKSTLVDALIGHWVNAGKKIGVLCVDPSSPFNLGALLGDRIRMNEWYNHPNVFIRSLATRGSLGGLHPKIIEITDVIKAAPFDFIIVETVGVGQSEIEIAGLADCTAVVVVPEGGDEVQTMKAGLMEIADLFVVNKADRPGADLFVKNLRQMVHGGKRLAMSFEPLAVGQHTALTVNNLAIIKTAALQKIGIDELAEKIELYLSLQLTNDKKYWLLAEKAFHLIQKKRMADVDKRNLKVEIEAGMQAGVGFNLYGFVEGRL